MRGLRALWLSSTIAAASLALPPRAATAFTLRVLAASELRIEPRLAADRSTLTLSVKLRDDRGAPLRNRTVRLEAPVDGAPRTVTLTTGANGEAEHVVALTRTQSRVDANAQYDGDGSTAPQRATIAVNLDAPYVTVDVVPPATAIELSSRAAPFVVVLRVGEVVSFPARDQGVELREGARLLASGVTDASGRAALSVDGSAFATAGVHRVRAITLVRGERVEGPDHDVLVHTNTSLTMLRREGEEDGAGATLHGLLTTAAGAPLPSAPVAVARDATTLAGAITDASGHFVVHLAPEALAEHGVNVRAVFQPTEPWLGASESATVPLTPPAPPEIPVRWVLAPALVAALALAAARARSRLRGPRAPEAPLTPREPRWDHVEHVAPSVTGGLRVRFVVVDRATANPVAEPMVRTKADPAWRAAGDEPMTVQPARRVEFELGASGYAPRTVTGEFSRPGEYVVRVQLRTWREELFERARPWLRRSAKQGALPTLREALEQRAAKTPEALAFVGIIEEGCYAPEAPGVREVERAQELAPVMEPPPTLARD